MLGLGVHDQLHQKQGQLLGEELDSEEELERMKMEEGTTVRVDQAVFAMKLQEAGAERLGRTLEWHIACSGYFAKSHLMLQVCSEYRDASLPWRMTP